MRYEYENAKIRFRKCAAISIEELDDRMKQRELHTELSMIGGYVGYLDIADYGVRIYAFANADDATRFIREARKIGFSSAGEVEGTIAIKNTELQRPHLKYMPRNIFLRELYK